MSLKAGVWSLDGTECVIEESSVDLERLTEIPEKLPELIKVPSGSMDSIPTHCLRNATMGFGSCGSKRAMEESGDAGPLCKKSKVDLDYCGLAANPPNCAGNMRRCQKLGQDLAEKMIGNGAKRILDAAKKSKTLPANTKPSLSNLEKSHKSDEGLSSQTDAPMVNSVESGS